MNSIIPCKLIGHIDTSLLPIVVTGPGLFATLERQSVYQSTLQPTPACGCGFQAVQYLANEEPITIHIFSMHQELPYVEPLTE